MLASFPCPAQLSITSSTEKGHTKFTCGAHDIIAITSPQKNDLYIEAEELLYLYKTLEEVSLPLQNGRFGLLFFF